MTENTFNGRLGQAGGDVGLWETPAWLGRGRRWVDSVGTAPARQGRWSNLWRPLWHLRKGYSCTWSAFYDVRATPLGIGTAFNASSAGSDRLGPESVTLRGLPPTEGPARFWPESFKSGWRSAPGGTTNFASPTIPGAEGPAFLCSPASIRPLGRTQGLPTGVGCWVRASGLERVPELASAAAAKHSEKRAKEPRVSCVVECEMRALNAPTNQWLEAWQRLGPSGLETPRPLTRRSFSLISFSCEKGAGPGEESCVHAKTRRSFRTPLAVGVHARRGKTQLACRDGNKAAAPERSSR